MGEWQGATLGVTREERAEARRIYPYVIQKMLADRRWAEAWIKEIVAGEWARKRALPALRQATYWKSACEATGSAEACRQYERYHGAAWAIYMEHPRPWTELVVSTFGVSPGVATYVDMIMHTREHYEDIDRILAKWGLEYPVL